MSSEIGRRMLSMARMVTLDIQQKEHHSTHWKHKGAFSGQRITFRSQSAEAHRGLRMRAHLLLHHIQSNYGLPQIFCLDALTPNESYSNSPRCPFLFKEFCSGDCRLKLGGTASCLQHAADLVIIKRFVFMSQMCKTMHNMGFCCLRRKRQISTAPQTA